MELRRALTPTMGRAGVLCPLEVLVLCRAKLLDRGSLLVTLIGCRYNITHNFFFEADAWKMDYGGHDSAVTHNVIYHGDGGDHDGNDGQNCLNIWSFLPEHGVPYNNNKCILPR